MVNRRPGSGVRGASTLGCVTSLVLLVGVLYYGINLGRVWWRYWEIENRMESAARFAQGQTVDQINRQLQADAEEVGLPPAARKFQIEKTDPPPKITISLDYSEQVSLPFLHRSLRFHPVVTHKFF